MCSEVGGTWCFENNTDYAGDNLDAPDLNYSYNSPILCQLHCQILDKCVVFTWNPSTQKCLFKSTKSFQIKGSKLTAGDKFCGRLS